MGNQARATKSLKISQVKNELTGIVTEVNRDGTRVLIEKGGIPVAAIISVADLDRFVVYEQQRAERFKVIDEIREAFRDVPDEEIERETDRIIARIRAENQAAREALAATRKQEQGSDDPFAVIDRMREAFKDVPDEEIEREADRAVAEIRGKLPVTT